MNKNLVFLLCFFVVQNAWAALYTNDISNGCVPNVIHYYDNTAKMTARWIPNSYTCNVNEFLPANINGCVACPMGQTCTGGTFNFNETETQGITYTTPILYNQNNSCVNELLKPSDNTSYMMAKFTPNVHNCNPGYYLPANVDACTICPLNNKCVGGTYTFNETTTQGIEPCNGSFAPTGSSVCYPHILHIGNEIVYLSATKRTTPSVNFRIGNDIFYANMTTTRTVMTAGSSHYFKTIYNNAVYYVCDDSVPECRDE